MFLDLVKSRHSAINFDDNVEVTEEQIKQIMEVVKEAPSTYNLQSTEYLFVQNKELKEKIYELSNRQHKIKTSSAVVIVLGNKKSLLAESAEKIYSPMRMLKMMSDEDYKSIITQIASWNKDTLSNEAELKLELHRLAAVSVSFFILAAKNIGLDTCPMHIVNQDEVRNLINVPDHLETVMMIVIGKSSGKVRPRGYRKHVQEILHLDKF